MADLFWLSDAQALAHGQDVADAAARLVIVGLGHRGHSQKRGRGRAERGAQAAVAAIRFKRRVRVTGRLSSAAFLIGRAALDVYGKAWT